MSDPPCPALASINKIWNGLFQNPTGGRQLVGYFRRGRGDADPGRRLHPARTRGHHAAPHLPADRRSDRTAGRLAGRARRSRGARHGRRPDRVGGGSARGRRQVPRHVGDRAALSRADRLSRAPFALPQRIGITIARNLSVERLPPPAAGRTTPSSTRCVDPAIRPPTPRSPALIADGGLAAAGAALQAAARQRHAAAARRAAASEGLHGVVGGSAAAPWTRRAWRTAAAPSCATRCRRWWCCSPRACRAATRRPASARSWGSRATSSAIRSAG